MKRMIWPVIVTVIVDILVFYLFLPVLSFRNPGLWLIVILNITWLSLCRILGGNASDRKKRWKGPVILTSALTGILLLGLLFSSTMFHARAYSSILNIGTGDLKDLPTEKELKAIPLMDTESSKVLGNRKIGSLNEIVSQFEVSDDYMTIAYQNAPVKVSALEYASFWKWNANHKEGIPGYIVVYPNDLTAEYIGLDNGMRYVPSAYFGEDLDRHIYFRYPTVFFETPHIELDEEGHPWYVAPTYHLSVGLFGGKTLDGAILVDPVGGDLSRYGLEDIPEWVDIVFHGDYITRYFDIYGRYLGGFWNSLFGQKGLIESASTTVIDADGDESRTNDFGYLVKDNDVYLYTGVTAITNDESNIGYILANERSGEVLMTTFESTDEDSVMRAAEGEVQEKGYRASFPSLLSIGGRPAYVMVLKDNLGLVKMYAIVDASQYSHMVVNDSLEKALEIYSGRKTSMKEGETKTVTIEKIAYIDIDGNTYVYLLDKDGNIYSSPFEKEMLKWEAGDSVTILVDGDTFYLFE